MTLSWQLSFYNRVEYLYIKYYIGLWQPEAMYNLTYKTDTYFFLLRVF